MAYRSGSDEDESLETSEPTKGFIQKKSVAKAKEGSRPAVHAGPKIAAPRPRDCKADDPKSSSQAAQPMRRRKLGTAHADGSLLRKWSSDATDVKKEGKEGRTTARPRVGRVRIREVGSASSTAASSASSGDRSSSSTNYFSARSQFSQPPQDAKDDVQGSTREPKKTRGQPARKATKPLSPLLGLEDDPFDLDDDSESEFLTALDLESETESSLDLGFETDSLFSVSDPLPVPRGVGPVKVQGRVQNVPSVELRHKSTPVDTLMDTLVHIPITSRSNTASRTMSIQRPTVEPAKARQRTSTNTQGAGAGELDDAFKVLQIPASDIVHSPQATPRKPVFQPGSPKKALALSPFKGPQIPESPWKHTEQEFWDAELQNQWIDQHSPKKTTRTKQVTDDKAIKLKLKATYGSSPEKRGAKKAFDQNKESVARQFLQELDERITDGRLGKLTAATGGVRLQWSSTLQSTAGRAHWKCKETSSMRELPDGSFAPTKERQHHAHIELATKVLANEADLLNTVAHEFCHLATFILDGKPQFAHGAEFKAWGARCGRVFGQRGIVVTTKHNYDIDYKYIWRCVDCRGEVHRHSKSVDPVKQRCGRCRGILEQVKPVPRAAAPKTAWQEFLAREMKQLKDEGKQMSLKDRMAIVSSRWKAKEAKTVAATATATATTTTARTQAPLVDKMAERMLQLDLAEWSSDDGK